MQLQDGSEANVYFLLEHKSSPDVLVAFQLLRYMMRIWERAQREKVKPLPPVIPIVVYHGREKWQVSENFTGLFEGPEALRPYWPDFRYTLQDVSQLDETDLHGNLLLKATILTLMRSFDPDLPEKLADIFRYLAELANPDMAVEFLKVVVVYVSATKEVTTKHVSDAVSTAFKDGGAIMSGFVQELIEQGKQEGLQEGLQEGQQALRSTILDLLMLRFDAAPPSITRRVGEITNLEELKRLARQAGTAESLTNFEQFLNTL